jgi:hypothetical protein
LADALDAIGAGVLALDLRGVEVQADLWKRVAKALIGSDLCDLSTARLAQAHFGEGAQLSGVYFGHSANLAGVTFGDGASLMRVVFGDAANLSEVTFGKAAWLFGVRFGDRAFLEGVSFGDRTSLRDVRFGDHADLSGAAFGDGAHLAETVFGDHPSLRRATFGDGVDLRGVAFGEGADLSFMTFGGGANLREATFGSATDLADTWFTGDASLEGVMFLGQQRGLGPLYAGGTMDLYDAQFDGETRLEIDAAAVILSRATFSNTLDLRVLRARVDASETTFAARATIVGLDRARRPIRQEEGETRVDSTGTVLAQAEPADASVWSLRRTDVAPLTIAGIRVDEARFAGAQSLEKLRLVGTGFERRNGRQRVREEMLLDPQSSEPSVDEQRMGHPTVTADQVAGIYRSLRKSREDGGDAPGGNDLYVGEQLMRRRDLRERLPQTAATRSRRALLALYAGVGGYGVRPILPAVWLGVLLLGGWLLAATIGLDKGDSADALVFAMRSMLLLPNSANVSTTTAGDALQVALRVLGPILIALIALGVRAQVKR